MAAFATFAKTTNEVDGFRFNTSKWRRRFDTTRVTDLRCGGLDVLGRI